ncbi:multicopper oxidase family protein [Intrasporangium calvum]|uniref:Multicopper oxidase family protein n=1 Tax=Intrasporangium calvum TaxID=53358 RepID=A0ABT5GI36_9MICO|nr:multicopper oxidase family protein [Intrasporangium calvum]MDC5697913.1 multicopper oxidase family protein [Intrasporangium calvum]
MADLSRRNALRLAGLGAATAVAGGVGIWRTSTDGSAIDPEAGGLLAQPAVLTSTGGRLEVELVAGRGVTLAGRETQALGYNGSSPGPTLHVRPGDTLRVRLTNRLDEATNLHTHGLHVSPEGRSDNIFRVVGPGESGDYEFAIPADHPAGTFWYHPHHHGTVADQLFGGLFGALIVAGADDPDLPERLLVVSDISLDAGGRPAKPSLPEIMAGREGDLVLVNGQRLPRLDVVAGVTERWRFVNACVSRFVRLQLDGHRLGLLGLDGQALGPPMDVDAVTLAPGNRADLVVSLQRAGRHTLRTLAVDRGGMGMMMGSNDTSRETALAEVRAVEASRSGPPEPKAWPGPGLPDLRDRDVARRRRITFTMGMSMGMSMGMGPGGMTFGFDGVEFDPARVDQDPRLGTVEEWTIANTTPMDHPFHLHVWPMQLIAGPGSSATDRPDWRDVVIVPGGGEVRVLVSFEKFGGRTVYHCHILDHEDRGMMGIVQTQG